MSRKGDVAASMYSDRSMTSKSPSSDVLSQLTLDTEIYKREDLSPSVEECAAVKQYNLCDLRMEIVYHQNRGDSDNYCSHYIKSIIEEKCMGAFFKMRKTDTECQFISKLSPLTASTRQRPDVAVSNSSDFPVLFIEVHSVSFISSLRKSIIGVCDQLRLYRMYDHNYGSLTAFLFPKLPFKKCDNKCCVVQVDVSLIGSVFKYFLKPLHRSAVKSAVETVLHNNKVPCGSDRDIDLSKYPFRLTDEELRSFGSDTVCQVPSISSILLTSEKHFFKHPFSLSEVTTLLYMRGFESNHAISLSNVSTPIGRFFRYNRVAFSPLLCSEAASCLYDLVLKVKQALQSLHELGWTHQDVRLPNICFNESFDAVLIDLDRCCMTSDPANILRGCMYNSHFSAVKHDYLQLGWLIAWVLSYDPARESHKSDYHKRCFEDLETQFRNDDFLKKLILEGKCTNKHVIVLM